MVATVDPQGRITARLNYDSYGNLIQSSGSLPDYRYAGLFYHAASGLSLATYRAYNPQTGRWLSRDPIREAGGINLIQSSGNLEQILKLKNHLIGAIAGNASS
ncbi:MAG: RHS repeat-associated core domain-containing protein [Halothiobacillus sp.]